MEPEIILESDFWVEPEIDHGFPQLQYHCVATIIWLGRSWHTNFGIEPCLIFVTPLCTQYSKFSVGSLEGKVASPKEHSWWIEQRATGGWRKTLLNSAAILERSVQKCAEVSKSVLGTCWEVCTSVEKCAQVWRSAQTCWKHCLAVFFSNPRTTDDFYLFLLLLELFFFQGSLAAKKGEEGKH